MNIICEKNFLIGAVNPALSVASTKTTSQTLEGFLLTANKDDGTIVICGYDMEKGVKVTVSGDNIQIIESGKIIVNAEKFSSVIKNMPDGNISITVDSKLVMSIKNKKAQFSIHGLDGEKFPSLPKLKGEKNLKISRKVLKSMISSILFSVGNTPSRPALNGALFDIKNNQLNVVSTDSQRLSLRISRDELKSNEELSLKFIIPQKSLSELLKLIGDADEPAEIELTNKHTIISFDNIIFFSRLIESEYIDYSKIIRSNPQTTVIVNTQAFLKVLERSAVLTDDKKNTSVTLNFKKQEINIGNKENAGILHITSESSLGKTSDECDIEIDGGELEIGFNQQFLFEALKVIKDEKILMYLESSLKALLILPYNDENKDKDIFDNKFLYLVLPKRLHKNSQAA